MTNWIFTGQTDILSKLLDRKANIEAKDVNGFSPLMVSVQQGIYKIAKELRYGRPKKIIRNDFIFVSC